MPGWAWALIIIAAVVIVAVIAWRAISMRRRTHGLQERFGPEYGRTLDSADGRRQAEADLASRAEQRDQLDIRPLPAAARDRYIAEWRAVQARFVDDPRGAAHDADSLIQSVMSDRGYPVDGFEQQAAVVSVDHPQVVENYREGHRLTRNAETGEGTTEDLRQAMRHYRLLFEDLVGDAADAPLTRGEHAEAPETAPTDERAVR